jgi:hypothetical protein
LLAYEERCGRSFVHADTERTSTKAPSTAKSGKRRGRTVGKELAGLTGRYFVLVWLRKSA